MIQHHPKIVSSGLIAYYDAANKKSYPGTGTALTDLTKNKNNASHNSITYHKSNQGALSLNGSSSNITVPNNSSYAFGTGDFTIDAYVNIRASSVYSPIVQPQSGLGTAQNDKWWFAYDPSITGLRLGRHFTSTYSAGSILPTSGAWYGFTYTRSNGTSNFYVNGLPVTVTNPTSLSGISFGQDGLSIGAMSNFTYLNGTVASLKVYNRSLSSNEVLQNYKAINARLSYSADPVLIQPMEGNLNNSGTVSSVAGTGVGTFSFTSAQSKTGSQSLDITGNGYYDIGGHGIGTGNFVVDLWYRSNSLYGSQSYYSALVSDTGLTFYIGSSSYWQATVGYVTVLQVGGNGNIYSSTSMHQIAWTRITMGRTSDNRVHLFFNGVYQGNCPDYGANLATPIRVGKWGGNTAFDNKSSGYVDDFKIYKCNNLSLQTLANIANGVLD